MDENPNPTRHELLTRMDDGWLLSSTFVSAVLAWTGIGWLLDRWLDTDPWLTAVGAMLGFGLGMYLAWMQIRAKDSDQSTDQPAGRSAETDTVHGA